MITFIVHLDVPPENSGAFEELMTYEMCIRDSVCPACSDNA